MEHTTVSEQFTRLDKLVAESTSAGYGLNVTFVYEDAATRKWAREVFERATGGRLAICPPLECLPARFPPQCAPM